MIPKAVIDVFLQPGEHYFGDGTTRIRTLLGSCVAITLWHPRCKIGGMCHFMLPSRHRLPGQRLDGRYGSEALFLLVKEARRQGTRPAEYEIKVFGGGNMFPGIVPTTHNTPIGLRNANHALHMLAVSRLVPKSTHIGGHVHRVLMLENWSGDVWMKQDVRAAPSTDREAVA